eukprot:m.251483 g.251483  ORF g.251483 m.251483 type:complete len:1129 (-) comp15453_c0_seq1:192-3578(-)
MSDYVASGRKVNITLRGGEVRTWENCPTELLAIWFPHRPPPTQALKITFDLSAPELQAIKTCIDAYVQSTSGFHRYIQEQSHALPPLCHAAHVIKHEALCKAIGMQIRERIHGQRYDAIKQAFDFRDSALDAMKYSVTEEHRKLYPELEELEILRMLHISANVADQCQQQISVCSSCERQVASRTGHLVTKVTTSLQSITRVFFGSQSTASSDAESTEESASAGVNPFQQPAPAVDKHSCRLCGLIVCSSCSQHTIRVRTPFLQAVNKLVQSYFEVGINHVVDRVSAGTEYAQARICNSCFVTNQLGTKDLANVFRIAELDLLDLHVLSQAPWSWRMAAGVLTKQVLQIKDQLLPESLLAADVVELLRYNQNWFAGHSEWMVTLLKAYNLDHNIEDRQLLATMLRKSEKSRRAAVTFTSAASTAGEGPSPDRTVVPLSLDRLETVTGAPQQSQSQIQAEGDSSDDSAYLQSLAPPHWPASIPSLADGLEHGLQQGSSGTGSATGAPQGPPQPAIFHVGGTGSDGATQGSEAGSDTGAPQEPSQPAILHIDVTGSDDATQGGSTTPTTPSPGLQRGATQTVDLSQSDSSGAPPPTTPHAPVLQPMTQREQSEHHRALYAAAKHSDEYLCEILGCHGCTPCLLATDSISVLHRVVAHSELLELVLIPLQQAPIEDHLLFLPVYLQCLLQIPVYQVAQNKLWLFLLGIAKASLDFAYEFYLLLDIQATKPSNVAVTRMVRLLFANLPPETIEHLDHAFTTIDILRHVCPSKVTATGDVQTQLDTIALDGGFANCLLPTHLDVAVSKVSSVACGGGTNGMRRITFNVPSLDTNPAAAGAASTATPSSATSSTASSPSSMRSSAVLSDSFSRSRHGSFVGKRKGSGTEVNPAPSPPAIGLKYESVMPDYVAQKLIAFISKIVSDKFGCQLSPAFNVVPLRGNFGIVEWVNGTSTLAGLQRDGSLARRLIRNTEQDDQTRRRFSASLVVCAIATKFLGIGDRHPDNYLFSSSSELFHVDFGHIGGSEPKPFCAVELGLSEDVIRLLGTDDMVKDISEAFIEVSKYLHFIVTTLRSLHTLDVANARGYPYMDNYFETHVQMRPDYLVDTIIIDMLRGDHFKMLVVNIQRDYLRFR